MGSRNTISIDSNQRLSISIERFYLCGLSLRLGTGGEHTLVDSELGAVVVQSFALWWRDEQSQIIILIARAVILLCNPVHLFFSFLSELGCHQSYLQ